MDDITLEILSLNENGEGYGLLSSAFDMRSIFRVGDQFKIYGLIAIPDPEQSFYMSFGDFVESLLKDRESDLAFECLDFIASEPELEDITDHAWFDMCRVQRRLNLMLKVKDAFSSCCPKSLTDPKQVRWALLRYRFRKFNLNIKQFWAERKKSMSGTKQRTTMV